jgi:hypothetical protein
MPSSAMPSGGGEGQPLYGVGGNGQPVKHWVVQSGWIRDPKTKQERFMTSEELDTYYIDGAYMTEEDAQKYMSQKDPKTGKPKWQFVEDLANVRPTGG